MSAHVTPRDAYAAAGVDVTAGERAVELLRERLAGAPTVDLLGGLSGFAAAIALPAGMREPVLVSATDGVGTKTEIARWAGRLDTIGWDLVAMCADDVVCHGARPWLFLDYLAVGRLDPDAVATIVGGVAAACDACGCALVGGETAEHPGTLAPEAFDLAGFCLGLVERDALLDGSSARVGDAILGLAASGLHANGFSLVRAVAEQRRLALEQPYLEVVAQYLGIEAGDRAAAELSADEVALGDVLLRPTRLYASDVLGLLEALRSADLRLSGLAHVTGGGLAGNLPRAVAPALAVRVRLGSWVVPSVVDLLASLAGMDGPEARATLNSGVGMAAVVEPAAVEPALAFLAGRGLAAWVIGDVVPAGADGVRYSEVA